MGYACIILEFFTGSRTFQTRLIVAQMTNTTVDGWNHQITLYSIATLICIAPYQMIGLPALSLFFETYVLLGMIVFFKCVHIHYAYGMINEMCDHLGIKCFTVRFTFYNTILSVRDFHFSLDQDKTR